MQIEIAITDDDINQCYPVIRELRPHVKQNEFLHRVCCQETGGYRLAVCRYNGEVVAVAGFHIGDNLAWGHNLCVDDLVTKAVNRSQGHGAALLSWIYEHAVRSGCVQVYLDSCIQRANAHRFYEKVGLVKSSFHFTREV